MPYLDKIAQESTNGNGYLSSRFKGCLTLTVSANIMLIIPDNEHTMSTLCYSFLTLSHCFSVGILANYASMCYDFGRH